MTKNNKLIFLSALFRSMASSINLSTGLILIQSITSSDVMATVIRSIAFFSTSIFTKPLNRLAQKLGRKQAIWLSCLINILSIIMIILASIIDNSLVMVVAVLLNGAGAAGLMQTRFFLTETSMHASKSLGRYLLVTAVGSVIGPSIVGMKIGGISQFTSTYIIVLLLTILGALSFYYVADNKAKTYQNIPNPKRKFETIRLDYFFCGLSYAMIQFIMTGTMTIVPLYLSKNGSSLERIGLLMSGHMIGMYLFSPVFSWLYEKIGSKLVTATFVIVILTEFACLTTENWRYSGINLFVIGLAWSSISVTSTMEMSKLSQAKMGWQGIFDTLYALFGGFGVLLSGVIFKVGGYHFVLIFYGILCFIMMIGQIYGEKHKDVVKN